MPRNPGFQDDPFADASFTPGPLGLNDTADPSLRANLPAVPEPGGAGTGSQSLAKQILSNAAEALLSGSEPPREAGKPTARTQSAAAAPEAASDKETPPGTRIFSQHDILRAAGIRVQAYDGFSSGGVLITPANQLIGTYDALARARSGHVNYSAPRSSRGPTAPSDAKSWEVHHIVEKDHLAWLKISHKFPVSGQQLCVLLPHAAHQKRINAILHRNVGATAAELLDLYEEAYDLIGDYCGGGERQIRQELLQIVRAVFELGAVRKPGEKAD